MLEKIKVKGNRLYRGEIPFFLKDKIGVTVYLCSSKKNLNDYYWCLKDFYKGEVIRQEGNTEDEYLRFNYKISDALKREVNFVVLVTMDYFLKEYRYSGDSLTFSMGEEIDINTIINTLDKEGYTRNYLIEDRKQYSQRGDVFDFFPINSEYPIRVELFHNEIDRINYFDLETQKSVEKIENFNMYIDSNKENNFNFLEYFKDKKTNLILENKEILEYKLKEIEEENPQDIERIKDRFYLNISGFIEIENTIFSGIEIDRYQNIQELKKIAKEKKIIICSEEYKRYEEILKEEKGISFCNYPLYEGFENNGKLYLTDRELKGIRVKREKREKITVRRNDLSEIKEGDYVIHESFGLGRYIGLKLINNQEYIELKYADQDKLFVSTTNLDRIEKYVVEPGKEPEIYRLGRKGFKRKREKLQEDIAKFAKEIVEIQGKRLANKGFRFSHDSIIQEEFEESFPYTLTPDQVKAVEDVKKDMESGRVMDRIICGDVGCGKTEVAIRAAFKAINDGKQVAIMAPTTILAQQHYERIHERLKNYPFTVELLSRIKTEKEQQEIMRRVENGSVDIVIGTHKILSEDLDFKELALVIIDEEQKFGVKAKEKLKTLKANVDMLTLTATPIPRTLNLALLGIRDISIISTLPPNRVPIKDFYIENNPSNIREAILKEYSREGQVYYLYNSVKKMKRKESELQEILPKFIKIASIHGQMQPKEIHSRLGAFENGDIDLLLTTTIIENGIDIENANTIIIEGLEKLGLSQLYQLRGRVGRGAEQGYSYIIVDSTRERKNKVKERENSMRSLDGIDSGAGFHLSLEDMRIRGAGEVLGEKQHGTIESLGYSLYMKLLHDEIDKIKGEYIEEITELDITLKGDRYIPKDYIETKERLKIYKRVAGIKKIEDLELLKEELTDRFGKMPKEALGYMEKEYIRILATIERILTIREDADSIYIKFIAEDINLEKILGLLKENKIKYLKNEDAIIYKGTIDEFFKYYRG